MAAAQIASAPPVPKPASQTPVTASLASRCATAECRSSSHPPSEKLPSDSPHPRKAKASAVQPISEAIRSASPGSAEAAASAELTSLG